MFNKTELTEKLTAELRELAKNEGINNADDLRKNDLIEQILQQQASKSTTAEVVTETARPIVTATKPKVVKENTAASDKPLAKKRARISKDDKSTQLQQPERERITLFDEPQTRKPETEPTIEIAEVEPPVVTLPPDFVNDPERLETIAEKLQNQANKPAQSNPNQQNKKDRLPREARAAKEVAVGEEKPARRKSSKRRQ